MFHKKFEHIIRDQSKDITPTHLAHIFRFMMRVNDGNGIKVGGGGSFLISNIPYDCTLSQVLPNEL